MLQDEWPSIVDVQRLAYELDMRPSRSGTLSLEEFELILTTLHSYCEVKERYQELQQVFRVVKS